MFISLVFFLVKHVQKIVLISEVQKENHKVWVPLTFETTQMNIVNKSLFFLYIYIIFRLMLKHQPQSLPAVIMRMKLLMVMYSIIIAKMKPKCYRNLLMVHLYCPGMMMILKKINQVIIFYMLAFFLIIKIIYWFSLQYIYINYNYIIWEFIIYKYYNK